MPDQITPPAVVEVHRGSLIESTHRAYVCVVDSDNKVLMTLGNPDHVTYMRSSAKPLQAAAMVWQNVAGRYELSDRQIAIIAGSHSGEPVHIETVLSILTTAELKPKALQCGVHPPFDESARKQMRETGIEPTVLHHNCSGKHAGMLLTALHLNENIDDYLNPESGVQKGIVEFLAMIADLEPADIVLALDGCNAPVHALPMRNAALTFSRLIEPDGLPEKVQQALLRVANTMRTYPEMIGANRQRICTDLLRTVNPKYEFVAKAGAEGYYAAGWRDPVTRKGFGMTIKMEDGAVRGRNPLIISVLQRFDVLPEELPEILKPYASCPVTNHRGFQIGEIKVNLGDDV
ncbi:asparaginase [bacterium]|nr:asparaginase [bacterium]